jgi:hypothetical protein
VGLVAGAYAVGYTFAAAKSGPWLQGIERVNVGVAMGLMGILGLLLTPIASPYRLSANSQYKRITATNINDRESAIRYLRFDAGRYGREKVEQLAGGKIAGQSKETVEFAKRVLAADYKYQVILDDGRAYQAKTWKVYPADRLMEKELLTAIADGIRSVNNPDEIEPIAAFVDLDGDSVDECVVFTRDHVGFFKKTGGAWSLISTEYEATLIEPDSRQKLEAALAKGDFEARPAAIKDFRVGHWLYHPAPNTEKLP